MSHRVSICLLGGFRAWGESGDAVTLSTRKSEALLAYLAIPAGRFHSRDALAALLWGDTSETQARQSLRQGLASIRRALGDGGEPMVLTQGDTVALNPELVTVDVAQLEAACADTRVEGLERAAHLYTGEFLAGFHVDEPAFEEWRTVQRERLHEISLQALGRLLGEQVRAGCGEAAIQTALRILGIDSLQEAVHRTLMRLLLRQGRRAAALRQYQTCVACLQRELGAEPEEETRQLYREILRAVGGGVPGVASATASSRVGGAGNGARAVESGVIGREDELERLRAAVPRMLDDGGQVVLVAGEAGIGKSRLIQEFLADEALRSVRVCFGRCYETEQTLPFRPWIEALRGEGTALEASSGERLSASVRTQLAALFPELSPSGGASAAVTASPAVLFEPLLDLVAALASERPVVVVLEDLQWADTMSARFLAFLARRLRRLQVLIVGSVRPEELVDVPVLAQAMRELRDEGRVEELSLRPLSEAESQALTRALRPSSRVGHDGNQLAHDIWSVSGGNPFVIVESVRNLQQRAPRSAGQPVTVGRRVEDVVAARLDRLAELPRHCVAVAAVIGRDFSFTLLGRAAHLDDRQTAAAVEELVRRRILDAVGDRLDFCHDWIRLVAYEGLLSPQRARLHGAVGDAIEEIERRRLDDVADELGTHYLKAGDLPKAFPHLVRFGHLAAQRYALDDAYRALGEAMAAVDHLPAPERDRCRLDVVLRQAFLLSILGRQREILDLLRAQADAVKRVADDALTAEYYFRLGLTHFFLGEHAEARLAGEQALGLGERIGDPLRIGKALHVLSLDAYEMGRPEEGIEHAARAVTLLGGEDMKPWLGLVYQDLALNYAVAGALDAALDATRQVEAIGRQALLPRLLPFAGYVTSWIHALRGLPDLAIDAARGALEISRDTTVTSLITATLGYAHLERGDGASAVSLLTQAIEQLRGSPVRHVEIRSLAFLAEAYLAVGDPSRARSLATSALELARKESMLLNVGFAQRALGYIAHAGGDLTLAEAHFSEALDTFSGCGARLELGRTRVAIASVLGARGERDEARAHLAAALAAFEAVNAAPRAAAARSLARALDLEVSPRAV